MARRLPCALALSATIAGVVTPALAQSTQKAIVTGVAADAPATVPSFSAEGRPNGSVDPRAKLQAGPLDWNRGLGLIRIDQDHWVRFDVLVTKPICDARAVTIVSGGDQRVTAATLGSGNTCVHH